MRGLFLIGTDTGVGKTAVAQALLRLARRRGFRLVPYKPAETGWNAATADAQKLAVAASRPDLTAHDICPNRLEIPVAPSVAARLAGRSLSADTILAHGRQLHALGDALLVECAGGLLTPYAPALTTASLAALFDIDVLVIAGNRLGTINHTALTVAGCRHHNLRVRGIVLVDVNSQPGPDHDSNAAEIAALTGLTPLGVLRHCADPHPDALADAAAADLDLSGLLDGAVG